MTLYDDVEQWVVQEGQQLRHYVRPNVAPDQAPLCQQVGSFTLSLFGLKLQHRRPVYTPCNHTTSHPDDDRNPCIHS